MRGRPLLTCGRRLLPARGCATLVAALLALIWQATWIGGDATLPSTLRTADVEVAMPLAPASRAEALRAADPAQRPLSIEPDDPPLLAQDAPAPAAGAGPATAPSGAAAFVPGERTAYTSRAPPGPA